MLLEEDNRCAEGIDENQNDNHNKKTISTGKAFLVYRGLDILVWPVEHISGSARGAPISDRCGMGNINVYVTTTPTAEKE